MENIDWNDRAFYDDDEWVLWSDIEEQIRHKEWGAKYPNSDRTLIPYFEQLLNLAEDYHQDTGLHLSVYGDIGELFAAITHGIKLNKTYAQGSDGRLGNDLVEVKTITPFKQRDVVTIDLDRNFSKLFVVKITTGFQVSGRMIDRKHLPKTRGRFLQVNWSDLPTAR